METSYDTDTTIDPNGNVITKKRCSCFRWLSNKWELLDENVLKPWLLYNWPHSKLEHEELTLKVKRLFNKKKNKIFHKIERDRKKVTASLNTIVELDTATHNINNITNEYKLEMTASKFRENKENTLNTIHSLQNSSSKSDTSSELSDKLKRLNEKSIKKK